MSTVYIPNDLVPDIVSRLPVKSLTRFKCVSKLWCRMIDSPGFIKIHLEKSKSNMKLIADVSKTKGSHLYDVGFTLCDLSNRKEINYPVIMDDYIYRISITGSCNGLICLTYWGMEEEETIVLWNPSTRKHLQLPIRPEKSRKNLAVHGVTRYALGYDESRDDYKIVRLERYYDYNNDAFIELSIFSLKSKKWKNLEDITFGDGLLYESVDTVFANGALYWLLSNNSILAFNLETDDIQFVPPPETSTPIKCAGLSVAFLNCCQHLVFDDISAGQKWITKDKCGSNYSWTKLTSDISSSKQLLIMRISCYSKNNVMFIFQKLEVEFPVKVKYLQAHLCFESLVRLDDAVTSNEDQVIEGRKRKQRKLHRLVRNENSDVC